MHVRFLLFPRKGCIILPRDNRRIPQMSDVLLLLGRCLALRISENSSYRQLGEYPLKRLRGFSGPLCGLGVIDQERSGRPPQRLPGPFRRPRGLR
jgi:hypothetical protein